MHQLYTALLEHGAAHRPINHDGHLLMLFVRNVSDGYGACDRKVVRGHVVMRSDLIPGAVAVVQDPLRHLQPALISVELIAIIDIEAHEIDCHLFACVSNWDGFQGHAPFDQRGVEEDPRLNDCLLVLRIVIDERYLADDVALLDKDFREITVSE